MTGAVVADDVALVRLGIAATLEPLGLEITAETALGREAARLAADTGAELLVLGAVNDLPLAEVVKRVKELQLRVVTLVPRSHRDELASLLALGTDGLVVRNLAPEELALAVERVLKGERVVAPALLSALVGSMGPTSPGEAEDLALTVREREVLALLAEGRSNREIASALYVTLATVKTHLAHVYAKLGVKNRNEALGRAVSLGLLG
ncbi:MAG: response regulator transcription factor [Acidimicrobiia bacterium]|nr:response regulator transcription factor [Acidimicrobiia bacterium]